MIIWKWLPIKMKINMSKVYCLNARNNFKSFKYSMKCIESIYVIHSYSQQVTKYFFFFRQLKKKLVKNNPQIYWTGRTKKRYQKKIVKAHQKKILLKQSSGNLPLAEKSGKSNALQINLEKYPDPKNRLCCILNQGKVELKYKLRKYEIVNTSYE